MLRQKAQDKVAARFNEPIQSLLNRLYHQEKRGIKDIAQYLGVSNKILWDWFNDLNIPRRDRSSAVSLQWNNNEQRRVATGERFKRWMREHPEQVREQSIRNNQMQQFRKGPTSIERTMMNALVQAGIEHQFQYLIGGKFLCDFAIIDAKIIIECDGIYWHSKPHQQQKDASKDAYLRKCGYTVLRFTDKQINEDIEACIHIVTLHLKRQA